MGLLDSILGAALSGATRQEQPVREGGGMGGPLLTALLPVVLGMLMNRGGGNTGGGLGDLLGGLTGRSAGVGSEDVLGGAGGRSAGGALGDILGGLTGRRAGVGIEEVIGGMLGGGAGIGGLDGLLQQMQRAGFAEQANSWVGTGPNQPVSPDAIGQILGSDALAEIAGQVGVTEAQASEGLAQLLPELVDHLTPEGSLPGDAQLGASIEDLLRKMAG